MTITTTCPFCGTVRFETEIDLREPLNDDETDTALAVAVTLHQIDAHLDDIAPDGAVA